VSGELVCIEIAALGMGGKIAVYAVQQFVAGDRSDAHQPWRIADRVIRERSVARGLVLDAHDDEKVPRIIVEPRGQTYAI
jgi:hypothetical protein